MLTIKIAALAVAMVAFTGPSFAQNFQGFGASSQEIQSYQSQNRPVALRTHKIKKHKAAP